MGQEMVTPSVKQVNKKYFWHDLMFMFFGVISYTFGWTAFILSQNITSGGLAGISTVIQLATNIPASYPYNVINLILLAVAFFAVSPKFAMRTVIGVGMLVVAIPVGQALFTDPIANKAVYDNIPHFLTVHIHNFGPLLMQEPFVALVLGSLLCGIGLYCVFSVNGSTGGTDVIVALFNKYTTISLGKAMIAVDATIILSSFFVNVYVVGVSPADGLSKLAFSAIEVIVCGLTVDFMMNNNRQSIQFMIFSTKCEEINKAILKLKLGTTILYAQGGFSGADAKVILVVCRKRQSLDVNREIAAIDPNAFVSQAVVKGVYGEGFDPIKKIKK